MFEVALCCKWIIVWGEGPEAKQSPLNQGPDGWGLHWKAGLIVAGQKHVAKEVNHVATHSTGGRAGRRSERRRVSEYVSKQEASKQRHY